MKEDISPEEQQEMLEYLEDMKKIEKTDPYIPEGPLDPVWLSVQPED